MTSPNTTGSSSGTRRGPRQSPRLAAASNSRPAPPGPSPGRSVWTEPRAETIAQACRSVDLLAGTAWLFARADLDETLDYLVIDEAGQVSPADALAEGTPAH